MSLLIVIILLLAGIDSAPVAQLEYTIEPAKIEFITNIRISDDGSTVALYDRFEPHLGVEIWDINAPELITVIPQAAGTIIYSTKLSASGNYLAIASQDGFDIWDIHNNHILISIDEPGDYAFLPDESIMIYTTSQENKEDEKTIIYSLVTNEVIETFDYPVTGMISVSPSGSSVVVGDILNDHVFNLTRDGDGTWISTDLSSEIGSFGLRDVRHYTDKYLLMTLDSAMFYGTYLRLIDLEAAEIRIVRTEYLSSVQVHAYGPITVIADQNGDFQFFDPLTRKFILERNIPWVIAGMMTDGSRYALLDPENNIDVFRTGDRELYARIEDCECYLLLNKNESTLVGWNQKGIYVYKLPVTE